MFGLQLLRNYVGKITFFERLPWIMETDSPSEVIVSSTEEHGLLAHLFQGRRQSNAAQGPRLEVVLPLLRKRCKTLRAEDGALHRGGNEKQKVEPVLESVSQTLSASLLHHVEATLCDVYLEQEHL
ncbi:hypothetical protein BKA82DRAFT_1003978 [Pisolithus tinctorius]|uniref:Uncharacterized protein n=1 Tax=Pisolithus tinctorius Marx 270 TaxID=870435 RepID=A0A0C3ITR9_PISTI|nr:hypothetical protein BKA82DRAFT_1003978 [Pisolithus tinctorius]KIO00283.1 hypothetical protein M404DRAFT_1003978 [Pisolithus tinctorius Marx 270]